MGNAEHVSRKITFAILSLKCENLTMWLYFWLSSFRKYFENMDSYLIKMFTVKKRFKLNHFYLEACHKRKNEIDEIDIFTTFEKVLH